MTDSDNRGHASYDPQALLNTQPVSLVIIDPVTYKVLYQNSTSRMKFGPIANETCHAKIAGCATPCSFCKASEALQTGETVSNEVELPTEEWLLVQWSKVETTHGQTHLVEAITDITELKRRQQLTDTLNRRLEETNRQLSHLNRQLEDRSVRDGLTGLYNHSYFQEVLAQLCAQAQRDNQPLSLLFLDLDHFKHINDTYGHAAGDQVLQAMGWLLGNGQTNEQGRYLNRTSDVAARYGGDEFALLLSNTPLGGAVTLAERLLRRVAALSFLPELSALTSPPLSLTCSIGVAAFPVHATNPADLVAAADRAVYAAKASGRNRVCPFVLHPPRC